MQKTSNLISRLAHEGAPKAAPGPSTLVLRWLALITLYFVLLLSLHGLRDDIGLKFRESLFLGEVLLMLSIVLLSALAAGWLSLPDINQKPWVRFVPLAPLSLFVGLLIYGMWNFSTLTLSECLQLGRFDCVVRIVLYGLLPGGVMFYVTAKAAPTRCGWAGSMIGLCVAGLGYILLRLVDPSDDPMQLVVWHFLPVLFMTVAGMVLGRRLLGRWLA